VPAFAKVVDKSSKEASNHVINYLKVHKKLQMYAYVLTEWQATKICNISEIGISSPHILYITDKVSHMLVCIWRIIGSKYSTYVRKTNKDWYF